ncbi:Mur ligase family protein, partial [Alphaproteobacteria bacterium]|nr:Mur ligase family protein [Alphaproteobacteria bacterium]
MRLLELIDEGKSTLRQDWTDVEINGLSADSRDVRPGYLFAAIPGMFVDGRNYIDAAIAAGASAILAPDGTEPPAASEDIPLITDANPRHRLAHMAARFFGQQPENIVAVTGTNGKTSVAHFVQQLWTLIGVKAASLGTLGVIGPALPKGGSLTTPDPVALHKTLSDLKADQFEHLCMEASSHGIDQNRLDGVRIKAAAFTNLSRDHLDYHQTFDAYRETKLRLFRDLLSKGGTIVANAETNEVDSLHWIANERALGII